MMRILILGSTGMLGQAFMKVAKSRNLDCYGMAESGADFNFDVQNDQDLINLIKELKPDVVINTIAIVSIEKCEANPSLAYLINSRPVSIIAKLCSDVGAYFIQVSTDHFFVGDKDKKHSEVDRVNLVNEYARTKYAAEQFALIYLNSLVVRTNIVGFRGDLKAPTFIEWAINALQNRAQMVLFNDFFTSSIDVASFVNVIFDKVCKIKPTGIINLASSDVCSKKYFITCLSDRLNFDVKTHSIESSVFTLNPNIRAESLGLDVSLAEQVLNCKLPTVDKVVDNLVSEYEERFL